MNTTSYRYAALAMFAFGTYLPGAALAEGGAIGGSMSLSHAKQEAVPIDGAPGHVLILGEAKGTNKSTAGSDFMDGGFVINREILQLFQGNGQHSGYITLGKGDDSSVALWNGEVSTVMSPEGQPLKSFKGNWEWVAGTGKYQGIRGNGEYSGRFTSQTSYVVDWRGKYSIAH